MQRFVWLAAMSASSILSACAPTVDDDAVAAGTTTDGPELESEGSSGVEGSQSGDASSGGADSDETASGEYEGAECFELTTVETEYGYDALELVDTCETPTACSMVNLVCPEDGEDVDCDVATGVLSDEYEDEAEDLTCVLNALASGQDARLVWGYTEARNLGWANRIHELWIVDGRWFHATLIFVDLSGYFGGFHEVEPLTSERVEACLAAEVEASRLACLVDPRTRSIAEIYSPEEGFE